MSMVEAASAGLARSTPATASAVAWLRLGGAACERPWPATSKADRPSAVEIRFSVTSMGVSLSRQRPTKSRSKRRAGAADRVGRSRAAMGVPIDVEVPCQGWEPGEDRTAGIAPTAELWRAISGRSNRGSKKIGARRPRRRKSLIGKRVGKTRPVRKWSEKVWARQPARPASAANWGPTVPVVSTWWLPMVMPISRAVMVPPANRANSESCRPHKAPATSEPDQGEEEQQPSSTLPASCRHQPSQAQAQDAKHLEGHDHQFKHRAGVEIVRRHTGSFLGHCKDCGKNDRDVNSADWGILDAIPSKATGGPNGGIDRIRPAPRHLKMSS